MQENWVHLEDFPGYMVSDWGNVQNPDGKLMTKSPIQYNIPSVGLKLPGETRISRRAVPILVAKAFLPTPEREDFITPIHLDGVRWNARADNLMWRPLWFAIKFHKDRRADRYLGWDRPIILVETGEMFESVRAASTKYGLLEFDIIKALFEPDHFAFPMGAHFLYAE